jgi:GNAT superfamily N-acetyltransferase
LAAISGNDDTGYEFALHRPEFDDEVVSLAMLATNTDREATAAYLRWKYEDNPYLAEPLIFVALSEGQVVAMRGAYGSCWRVRDRAYVLPCFGDLVVSEEHRNRGLLPGLMAWALRDLDGRGFSHACSLSPGRIAILGSLATGWKAIGSVQQLALRRGPGRIRGQARRHRRLVSAYGKAISSARRLPFMPTVPLRAGPDTGAFAVLDGRTDAMLERHGVRVGKDPRSREMAELADEMGSSQLLRHDRSEAYLDWRFGDPRFRYRFLYANDDALDGYLILGALTRRWSRDARILDWCGRTTAVRESLLTSALELGGFHKLSIWSVSLDEPARAILRRRGFEDEDQASWSSSVLVRPVGAIDETAWSLDGIDLRRSENWELVMMASDSF